VLLEILRKGSCDAGHKFETALPKVDSLFWGSGLATISLRDSHPFFDPKITPICLAINFLWTAMFDRLLRDEIPRDFSPYFAA